MWNRWECVTRVHPCATADAKYKTNLRSTQQKICSISPQSIFKGAAPDNVALLCLPWNHDSLIMASQYFLSLQQESWVATVDVYLSSSWGCRDKKWQRMREADSEHSRSIKFSVWVFIYFIYPLFSQKGPTETQYLLCQGVPVKTGTDNATKT